jgi:hypothetical protein
VEITLALKVNGQNRLIDNGLTGHRQIGFWVDGPAC